MATTQVSASVQNDGNFAHLDQFDPATGLIKRIEVFRCSHPIGPYGCNGAGTHVGALCGPEHLLPHSNRIHRSVYSEGQRSSNIAALLEIREEMHPEGLPEGSWDVRVRDLDSRSATYGTILHMVVRPERESNSYEIIYQLLRPRKVKKPALIMSPLVRPCCEIDQDFSDIGESVQVLTRTCDAELKEQVKCRLTTDSTRAQIDKQLSVLREVLRSDRYTVWISNTDSFLQFGDLGPKTVHPGINLSGEHQQLVSDYIVWRKYRVAMVLMGRVFTDDMAKGSDASTGPLRPGESNTRPGVYSIYVMAYRLNIGLYKLVLDKVYSDYGGVPMKLAPGSRIETGREPILDASRAIKSAAEIAEAYYLRQ